MGSARYYALFLVAFICPPVAVLIARNEFDNYFWINLILTLLAFLPGVAHAFWVLCSRNPLAEDEEWFNAGYSALTRPAGKGRGLV